MAGISLRQLRKSYGKTEVIHGVDCDIPDGEFVVVVGPSGCGKSTLLRTIAGLESVTEGEIKIGDQVVNHLEPAERDIAMVFQNYALYPHMTVFDNMAYGLRNRQVPKRDIQSRVREVADILEIAPLLARKPRQLSGGQRQRVAMGRAIVREPSVFLFDEPLSNLDAKLRVQMRLEIKRLHERLHITSVYVTHDQVEAMTLGQRLIVMNAGHVEQIGPPLALYQHPRTRFVADFIGSPSMNMFSASITPDGQGIRLGGETILSTDKPVDFPGRPITLGIRPEHFQLVEASQSTIQCSVDLVEELGADTLVYGHIGADATVVTVRVPGMIPVQSGDKLPLTVAPEHLHLFDADSGGRLG